MPVDANNALDYIQTSLLDKDTTRVSVLAYLLTNPSIILTLEAVATRKIPVRILLDYSQSLNTNEIQQLQPLKALGATITITASTVQKPGAPGGWDILHFKTMIIETKKTYIKKKTGASIPEHAQIIRGSTNFTTDAFRQGNEIVGYRSTTEANNLLKAYEVFYLHGLQHFSQPLH